MRDRRNALPAHDGPPRIMVAADPQSDLPRLPDAERLYLDDPAAEKAEGVAGRLATCLPMHPLLVYDAEAEEVLFLNRDRNGRQVEYLSYTTGKTERDLSTAGKILAIAFDDVWIEGRTKNVLGFDAGRLFDEVAALANDL